MRFGATAVEADGKGEADLGVRTGRPGKRSGGGVAFRRHRGTIVLAGTVSPTPGVTFDPDVDCSPLAHNSGSAHNYAPQDLRAASTSREDRSSTVRGTDHRRVSIVGSE